MKFSQLRPDAVAPSTRPNARRRNGETARAELRDKTLPSRGRIVPELKDVGLTDFREILFKPYRIVYFVSGRRVFVHCIFDGRRDVEDVLSERFLRG